MSSDLTKDSFSAKLPGMDTKIEKRLTMDDVMYGTEPEYSGPVSEEEFLKFSRFHENVSSKKEYKHWILEYVKTHSDNASEEIAAIQAVSVVKYEYSHRPSLLARLATRGAILSDPQRKAVETEIAQLVNTGKEIIANPEREESTGHKPDIQDNIKKFAMENLGEFETGVDVSLYAGTISESFHVFEKMKEFGFKANHARVIKEYYQTQLDDVNQPDGEEIYRKAGLLRKIYEFIISECDRYAGVVKTPRKPRKIRPDKMVKKVKYLEKDETLKISSIHPIKIINATELWVFNTKYRHLIYFKAKDADGFRIKGCTLKNYDVKESYGKTLRHPETQLPELLGLTRANSLKMIEGIKAVPKPQKGRINDNCLLLKVY